METTAQRRVPLIVVAGREGTAALVEALHAQGAVVYQTRTPKGCLRVATTVGPDMIVLPRGFPRRLARLLRQHPTSAGAKIVWFQRPATTADDRASRDAVVLADDGVAVVDELAQIANQVAAPVHPVQPLQLANLADEDVVTDNGSDPPRHAAARQVTDQDLARLAGQLAGEGLERSDPAHA